MRTCGRGERPVRRSLATAANMFDRGIRPCGSACLRRAPPQDLQRLPLEKCAIGRRPHSHPGEVRIRDRLEFESLRRGRHARQRLCQGHRWLGVALFRLVKTDRVDTRDHIIAQVGRLEAFRLEPSDERFTCASISISREA